METIIKVESTKKEYKVKLPYYTKVLISPNTPGIFSMSKVIDKEKCIRVLNDEIIIAHAGLAFHHDTWQEATKEEFEEFFKQTGQSLTDLAL